MPNGNGKPDKTAVNKDILDYDAIFSTPGQVDTSASGLSKVQDYREKLANIVTPTSAGYGELFAEKDIQESKYDKFLTPDEFTSAGIDENRGQMQTAADKWANASAKMLGLAATTFAETFSDIIVGIPTAIAKGNFSGVYDNAISDKFQQFNDWMEKTLPNYYTQEELDNPFYKNFDTANFWADKFLKNMGFTLGAMAGAIVTSGLSAEVLGMSKGAKFFNSATKLADLGSGAVLTKEGASLADDVIKQANKLYYKDIFNQALNVTIAASTEAGIEAHEGIKSFTEKMVKEIKDTGREPSAAEMQEINAKAMAYGNTRYMINLPLLTISDGLQFGAALSRGYTKDGVNILKMFMENPTKAATILTKEGGKNIKQASAKEIAEAFANKSFFTEGLTGGQKAVKRIQNIAGPMFREGIYEEMGQYAIEKGASDYYDRLYHKKNRQTLDDVFQSIGKGLIESYGSNEGWEQGFIGALTGMIGMPGFKYKQNENGKRVRDGVTMYGGVWNGKIKEINEHTQKVVDQFNSDDKAFTPLYKNALNFLHNQEKYSEAIKNGDHFMAENTKYLDLVSMVQTYSDLGMLDVLKDRIRGMQQGSPEDWAKMFNFDAGKIDQAQIHKITESVLKNIDRISQIKDAINIRFKGASSAIRDTLITAAATVENSEERLQDLAKQIGTLTGHKVDMSTYKNFINPAAAKDVILDMEKWKEEEKPSPEKVAQVDEFVADTLKLLRQKEQAIRLYETIQSSEGEALFNKFLFLHMVKQENSIIGDMESAMKEAVATEKSAKASSIKKQKAEVKEKDTPLDEEALRKLESTSDVENSDFFKQRVKDKKQATATKGKLKGLTEKLDDAFKDDEPAFDVANKIGNEPLTQKERDRVQTITEIIVAAYDEGIDTFSGLINYLQNELSPESVERMYNTLRDVYAAVTGKEGIKDIPLSYYTKSDEEFFLEEEQKRRLEQEAAMGNIDWNNDALKEAWENIEGELKIHTSDDPDILEIKKGTTIIGRLKVETGHSLAYLSAKYEFSKKDNTGRYTNTAGKPIIQDQSEKEHHTILDPKTLKPGEEIILSVNKDTSIKESLTQSMEDLIQKIKDENLTYEQLTKEEQKLLKDVPIKVEYQGKTIAHIHNGNRITSTNTGGDVDNLMEQREINTTLRMQVITNGQFITSVTEKGPGNLMFEKDEKGKNIYHTLEENGIESTLYTVVPKGGTWFLASGKSVNNVINTPKFEGAPHKLIPMANGTYMAVPVRPQNLQEEDAKICAAAVKAFVTQDKAMAQKIKEFIHNSPQGQYLEGSVDVLTGDGLQSFLGMFFYTTSIKGQRLNDLVGEPANGSTHFMITDQGGKRGVMFFEQGQLAESINEKGEPFAIINPGQSTGYIGAFSEASTHRSKKAMTFENNEQALLTHFLNTKYHVSLQYTNRAFSSPRLNENGDVVAQPDINTYNKKINQVMETSLQTVKTEAGDVRYAIQPVVVFDENPSQIINSNIETVLVKEKTASPLEIEINPNAIETAEGDEIDLGKAATDSDNMPAFAEPLLASEEQVALVHAAGQGLILTGREWNPEIQNIVVDNLANMILGQLIKHDGKLSAKDAFAALWKSFSATNGRPGEMFQKYNHIIEAGNWETLRQLTVKRLLDLGLEITLKKDKKQKEHSEQPEIDGIEDTESMETVLFYDDSASFMLDPKDSLSQNIRMLIAFVKDKQGPTHRAFNSFIPADEVANFLLETLSDTAGTVENLFAVLKEQEKSKPWVAELIKNLEKKQAAGLGHILNEMVVYGNKTNAKRLMLLWNTYETGEGVTASKHYSMNVIEVNRNNIAGILTKTWLENFKKIINKTHTGDGPLALSLEKRKELLDEYKDITAGLTEGRDVFIPKLISWLEKMGIVVNKDVIDDILDRSAFHGGSFNAKMGKIEELQFISGIFNSKTGTFFQLAEQLKSTELATDLMTNSEGLSIGTPFADNSGLNKLAKTAAKFSDSGYGISYRNGQNKLYQSFVMQRHTDMVIRDLLDCFDKDGKLKPNSTAVAKAKNPFTNVSYTEDDVTVTIHNSNCSWLEQILDKDDYFRNQFGIFWVDAVRNKEHDDSANIAEMSPREHEISKLSLFYNGGKQIKTGQEKRGIGNFLFLTPGDKGESPVIRALRHTLSFSFEGGKIKLEGKTKEELFKLAKAELHRIQHAQDNEKTKTIPGYKDGATKSIFFKSLNDKSLPFWKEGKLDLKDEHKSLVIDLVMQDVKTFVEEKRADWKEHGIIDKTTNGNPTIKYVDSKVIKNMEALGLRTSEQRIEYMLNDFVVNYMIAYANMFQIFAKDPATMFKGNPNASTDVWMETTLDNVAKRMTKETAPSSKQADSEKENENYNFIMINDAKVSSGILDRLKALGLDEDALKEYGKMEATDGQEFITVLEKLYTLNKYGKIDDKTYAALKEKYLKDEDFSVEDIKLILQPEKPVTNADIQDNEVGAELNLYVKSSAIPLLPGIVRGTPLDHLKNLMEGRDVNGKFRTDLEGTEKGNRIARAACASAVKVAASNMLQVFDGNEINDLYSPTFEKSLETSILSVKRSAIGIQQELPLHEDKEEISRSTQAAKLLFSNILKVLGFKYKGKEKTGKELYSEYIANYKTLYSELREKLYRQIMDISEDGKTISISKLSAMLNKHLSNNGVSTEILESLTPVLDHGQGKKDFMVPLWSMPFAEKIEAALASLISNNITRIDMQGMSNALATNAGMQKTKQLSELTAKEIDDIVYLEGYDATKGLMASYEDDNGVIQPDQIIVPWKFVHNGKKIDMKQFIIKGENGVIYLDTKKVDPELLTTFGFRIPNQGHNSMGYMQIVGFLPEYMTDMVIAPAEFTKRMGSDFDIDKLYNYLFHTYYDAEAGTLSKYKGNNAIKNAQNNILEIHLAVLKNNDKAVQKQLHSPLGFGDLKELAAKAPVEPGVTHSLLNPDFQRELYMSGRSYKAGVGVFSADSVFHATAQIATELSEVDMELIDAEGKPVEIAFSKKGVLYKTSKLGQTKAISEKKDKLVSDVHSAFQSAAVDGAKEKITDKLNVNGFTFNVYSLLNELGFDEEFSTTFMLQPIIRDYVKKMLSATDTFSYMGFRKAKESVKEELLQKYGVKKEDKYEAKPNTVLSFEDMNMAIHNPEQMNNFNQIQQEAIEKFFMLLGYGEALQQIKYALNTDSKHISSSMFEAYHKQDSVENVVNNSMFSNTHNLLGEKRTADQITDEEIEETGAMQFIDSDTGLPIYIIPNTINGLATSYGLFTTSIYNQSGILPYNNTEVKTIIDDLIRERGLDNVSNTTEAKEEAFAFIRTYALTNTLNKYSSNLQALRERLFFDKNGNQSLATLLEKIQDSDLSKGNSFLKALRTDKDPTGKKPSLILINTVGKANMDESRMYQGFVQLFGNRTEVVPGYTIHDFAEDLIFYSYLGAIQNKANDLSRYIPFAALKESGFAKTLRQKYRNISFEGFGVTLNADGAVSHSAITEQFLQHFPEKAVKLKPDSTQYSVVQGTKINPKVIAINDYTTSGELYKLNKEGQQVPKFKYLSIRTEKGYTLYKYTGMKTFNQKGKFISKHTYTAIDKLGQFGLLEITPATTSTTARSSVTENQKGAVEEKVSIPVVQNSVQISPPAKQIDNVTEKAEAFKELGIKLTKGDEELNKQQILGILSKINETSKNPLFKQLAGFIKDALANTTGTITMVTNAQASTLANGKEVAEKNTAMATTFRPSGQQVRIVLNYNKMKNFGRERNEQTILHELVHAISSNAIQYNPQVKQTLNSLLKRVRSEIQKGNLKGFNADELELFELLSVKYYEDKDSLSQEENEFLAENKNKYYFLSNEREFLAELFTSPSLQDALNTVVFDGNKSFMDRFIEIIKSIFEGLTNRKITKGTALEQALTEGMKAIDATLEVFGKQDPNVIIAKKAEVVTQQIEDKKENLNKDVVDQINPEAENALEDFLKALEKAGVQTFEPSIIKASQIYDKLGDKTVSENVVIKDDLINKGGINPDGSINALRNSNSEEHFGNPWSSVLTKGTLIPTSSTKESVVNYINWVLTSTESRAVWIREQIKSGRLKGKPIYYYKELGEPSHATALDYLINKYTFETKPDFVPAGTTAEGTIDLAKPEYELFPGVYANKGQAEAIDKLNEFLKSKDKTFTLIGRGGTGKTTIISKIIKDAQKRGDRIGGIAVAHKAKRVLGKSIGPQYVTTVASALGIKLNESTGKFEVDEFARKKGIPIQQWDLIIVDEASMISSAMMEEIERLAPSNAKIIFMGDAAQLPPIGESEVSPVFNKKNKHELTEKMRQAKTSPIIGIGTLVADNTESDSPVLRVVKAEDRISKFDEESGSSLIYTNNEEVAINSLVSDLAQAGENTEYARAITFNNENHASSQSVKNLNIKIREKLFGEKAKEQVVEGELLTSYASYIEGDQVLINNSDDFIVKSIKPIADRPFNVSAFSRAKGTRSMLVNYDIIMVTLQDADGRIITVPMMADSSKAKFNADLAKLANKDWQLYFTLQGIVANLQPGYAITTHKSQGSTYTNAYVFEDNILGPTNASDTKTKNQALYVAVSRPKIKLIMISNQNPSSDLSVKEVSDDLPSFAFSEQEIEETKAMEKCKGGFSIK